MVVTDQDRTIHMSQVATPTGSVYPTGQAPMDVIADFHLPREA